MITIYECEVCHQQYDNQEDCLLCENRPKPTFNFKIGEKVNVWSGYHQQNIVRIIKHCFVWNHKAAYELDNHVHTGDRTAIGAAQGSIIQNGDSLYEGHDFLPALEKDLKRYIEM